MTPNTKKFIRFSVNARYGLTRSVELIDKEKGIFRMWGSSHYCRGAEGMFDFEGGPMLMVGEDFYGYGTIAALGWKNPDDPEFTSPAENVAVVYVSVNFNKKGLKKIQNEKETNQETK